MPASEGTYGRFYLHPQLQEDDTYKDVVYVEIFIKGNKNTSFSRPAKEEDKVNWPKAWEAFNNNSPEMADGNPITVLPGMGPSQALNLQALGIFSIEDLAELSDSAVMDIQGGRTLKNRAIAYLAALDAETVEDEAGDPVNASELSSNPDVVSKEPAPKKKRKYTRRKTAEAIA